MLEIAIRHRDFHVRALFPGKIARIRNTLQLRIRTLFVLNINRFISSPKAMKCYACSHSPSRLSRDNESEYAQHCHCFGEELTSALMDGAIVIHN
jgi:hypothetical protein